jgi:anti-anti-sigma factor
MTGVCQYDTRLFPDQLLSRLVDVHSSKIAIGPGATRVTKRAAAVAEQDAGELVVSGEIDIAIKDFLWTRLEEHLFGQADVVVDVGGVSFIDVSGCRVLVRAAKSLPEGRRLVLTNPTKQLVRTLSVCGWADHPQLVVNDGPACGLYAQRGCA